MQCDSCCGTNNLLNVGDGPISTMLAFLDLRDLARTASTCHYLNDLCEQEWVVRDSVLASETKSRAKTPKERLRRLVLGQNALSAASQSFVGGTAACPQHIILKHSESSERMLRLYSISKQSQLWEGFLPVKSYQQHAQGASIGWQLDVAPLSKFWSQLVKPLPTSAWSSLEAVSQLVEDLLVVLVDVGHEEPGGRPAACLVTCTQGVALSQRQHTSEMDTIGGELPSTFVLRQQLVQGVPVVVHLSLKAHADVLDEINVSYFCLRY